MLIINLCKSIIYFCELLFFQYYTRYKTKLNDLVLTILKFAAVIIKLSRAKYKCDATTRLRRSAGARAVSNETKNKIEDG
jgi:hypothetical protein